MDDIEEVISEMGNEIFAVKLGLQSLRRTPELEGNATIEQLLESNTRLAQLYDQIKENLGIQ